MGMKDIIYDWNGYNIKIFYLVNGIQGELYENFMQIGSRLGYHKMFFLYFPVIALVAYFCTRIKKESYHKFQYIQYRNKWEKVLLTLCLAYGFSAIWVSQLKAHFQYLRPFARLPEGSVNTADIVKLSESPMASFPSGHSSFAMMMAVSIWPILSNNGKIFACLYVIWVGISRLALGAHFPADVSFGFLISFTFAYTARKIAEEIINRRIIRLLP